MKRILIALTTLSLVFGTAHAASFRAQGEAFETTLATWHSENEALYTAAYTHSSLSEVVDGYWRALHALGYTGSLKEVSARGTTYVFEGAQGTLEATFTLSGEEIITTLNRDESYT